MHFRRTRGVSSLSAWTRRRNVPHVFLGSPRQRRQCARRRRGRKRPSTRKKSPPAPSGVKLIIPITPPGRQTRSSSLAVASWFGANIAPKHEVTTSNSPSPKGSASASPSIHSRSTPASRAARRPASKFSGVTSDATTLAPACAARMATLPVPAATSRTRWPAETPHARPAAGPAPRRSRSQSGDSRPTPNDRRPYRRGECKIAPWPPAMTDRPHCLPGRPFLRRRRVVGRVCGPSGSPERCSFRWKCPRRGSTRFRTPRTFASIVLPGAQHVVSYHIIRRGRCWAALRGDALCGWRPATSRRSTWRPVHDGQRT